MPYLLNLFRAGLMFCLTAAASLATPEQAEIGKVDGFTGLKGDGIEMTYLFSICHSWIARRGQGSIDSNTLSVATISLEPTATANIHPR